MRPLRLEMEGFGAFRERAEVDFVDADLAALVGPTGAGKSTIIDALTFALYGCVARYDDDKLVWPVVNQTSTQARVLLDFELNGDEYRAVRVVRRTKTGATTPEARLERGAEVLAADARSVTKRVTELLGLRADEFNKTVVLPQGRFAEFLHDKPATRQATMRSLLDLGLYEQLGRAARARAATAKAQVDGYAHDIAELEPDTSAERRTQLDAAVAAVEAAEARLAAALVELEGIDAEVTRLEMVREQLAERVAALGAVVAPDGLGDLAADRRQARAEVASAGEALEAARAARQAALAAAAEGPDLVGARLQVADHDAHLEAGESLAALEAETAEVERVAAAAAAALTTAQAAIDELADVTRRAEEAEQAALEARDAAPDAQLLQIQLATHERLAAARVRDTALAARLAEADAAVSAAAAQLDRARAQAEGQRAELAERQARAGAAGLVALLRVGEPCPVCEQTVPALPSHHTVDDDLAAARRAATEAERAVEDARTALAAAEKRAATVSGERSSLLDSIAADEATVVDAPPVAVLTDAVAASAVLTAAAADARTAATQARAAWQQAQRDETFTVARQRAAATEQARVRHETTVAAARARCEATAAKIAGHPTREAAGEAVATALRLAAARVAADAAVVAAEAAEAAATAAARAVDERSAAARRRLAATRDAVANLGPPPVDDDDVEAGWRALTTWAAAQQADLVAADRSAGDDLAAATKTRDELIGAVRDAVRTVVPDASGDRERLRDALAGRRAELAAEVTRFEARRDRLIELRARVARLRDDGAVADTLGHLLRADGFEGWLMAAALEELGARATTRLYALSGGQFSLVVEDREFLVCDHRHADERRGIRTLSGGETFLASLALALALSEATAELAPEGAPTIESIFLDEGFGTLDPETMDTVAAAIEELGASGRMVVLVTHIRELADRMPVRFEVSRGPTTSSVERVEV